MDQQLYNKFLSVIGFSLLTDSRSYVSRKRLRCSTQNGGEHEVCSLALPWYKLQNEHSYLICSQLATLPACKQSFPLWQEIQLCLVLRFYPGRAKLFHPADPSYIAQYPMRLAPATSASLRENPSGF